MKKEIKKETKVKEKKTVVKEEKQENNVVFNSDVKKGVKILALITAFVASLVTIFVFIFGIITSLNSINQTKEELLTDNFTVTFISNLNGKTLTETQNIVEGYGSKALFVTFNIVIPALAIICVMILLLFLVKQLLDFINSTDTEKKLFTASSLLTIEKLICILEVILTISFIVFQNPGFIIYALISLLLFVIIGLFAKVIEYKNK